jgi:hypothetical protein
MKVYRIQFATGWFSPSIFFAIVLITILALTIVGVPLAVALLPTLYRIVEEPDASAVRPGPNRPDSGHGAQPCQ